MSTAYSEASVIIPNSAGVKAGTLQAWRPDVNLLQDIDVSRPATTNVASYIDNTGTRVFVGANIARWDWSEGGSCPSLLVEEQRTNLFDQDLAGAGIVTKTVTVVNGTEYSVSVEGSGSMTLSGAGTGTVTEGSHVTFTASTTSLTLTYTAPLTYVQVEAGAYPSSIIYTNGSTATRNADVISKTGISSLIGQSEGTLFIEVAPFDVVSANYISLINSNNTSESVLLGFFSNSFRSSVANNITNGGSPTPNVNQKLAITYKSGDIALNANGSLIDTNVTIFSPLTMNSLELNSRSGGPNAFFGKISALAWWKIKLTNAEAQTLTNP